MTSTVIEKVTQRTVSCDGGVLGHPLVYLYIDQTGQVTCPYCSKSYVLQETTKENGAGGEI